MLSFLRYTIHMEIPHLSLPELQRIKLIQGVRPLAGKISLMHEVVTWLTGRLLSLNMANRRLTKELKAKEEYIEQTTGRSNAKAQKSIQAPTKKD